MKIRIKLILMLLVPIALSGCFDFEKLENQFNNIEIEGNASPTFVFPLIKSSITFDELAQRSDANTLIYTVDGDDTSRYYMGFIDTLNLDNEALDFDIPDTSITFGFSLNNSQIPSISVPQGIQLGPFPFSLGQTFEALEGSKVKRIDLSQGKLSIKINSTFKNIIRANLNVRSIRNKTDNTPIPINVELGPQGNLSTGSFDLKNYYIDLYDEESGEYNKLMVDIELTLISTGYIISSSDELNVEISIEDLDFSTVYGRLYKEIWYGDRIVTLGAFTNTLGANLHLEETNIKFYFNNSFGLPLSFSFPRIIAKQGNIIDSLVNEGYQGPNTLRVGVETPNVINYPSIEELNPLVVKETMLELNNQNSNIVDIINFAPNELRFHTRLKIGSSTDTEDTYFIDRNSTIGLVADVIVPLFGYADLLLKQDTLDAIDFPSIDFINEYEIDSAKIDVYFKVNNGTPINIDMQAYFVDSLGVIVDSLFHISGGEHFIRSAEINENGEAYKNVYTEQVVKMSSNRYNKIRTAKKIVLRANIHTGGTPVNGQRPSVVIRKTDNISIEMSVSLTACV